MKKLLRKIICLTLAVFTLFSYTACNVNGGNSEEAGQSEMPANAENHQLNYTETNNWLLKNGQTDYVIVTPTIADAEVGYARDELISYFEEAIKTYNIPITLGDIFAIAGKKPVCADYDSTFLIVFPSSHEFVLVRNDQRAQSWGEPFDLFLPVIYQRLRSDDKRWSVT